MSGRARVGPIRIVAITVLLFWAASAQASIWYVATTGTNNSSCGSAAAPCLTISYALSNKLTAGDTIKVKAGIYTENLTITNTSHHDSITITADDPSNKPQLNGTVDIQSGVSGVTLSYLKIQGAPSPSSGWWTVVMLRGQNLALDHNEIWNGGTCVYIRSSGKNTKITNNNIHHCGVWGASDSHAINLVNNNGDLLPASWDEKLYIYNNIIHDGGGDGFQDSQGQAMKKTSKYIEIAYNDIYGWDEDALDFKGSQFVRIHHNKLHNNGGREWGNGINTQDTYSLGGDYEIWDNQIYDNWGSGIFQKWGAPRMKVWNNLMYHNSHSPIYNSFAVISEAGCGMEFYNNVVVNSNTSNGKKVGGIKSMCTNNVYKNNIFYNNGQCSRCYGNIMGSKNEGLGVFEYNYVYPTSPGKAGDNALTECYVAGNCPGFADIVHNDFHLLKGSPNLNAGTALGSQYDTDFDGRPRPGGKRWDIGAYQSMPEASVLPSANLMVVP